MEHRTNTLPSGYFLSDRFCIESVLGYGGFSITYKAVHRFLPERFAIKEYFPQELAFRDRDGISVLPSLQGQQDRDEPQSYYEWGLDRFLDEARILYAIDHPHVVRVRDYFPANGTAYLVMHYEEGEPLSRLLSRTGTLPEDQVRRLLNELLDALEAVHAKGYLHRDLKPENIYLRRRDGGALLIDFGSARQTLIQRSRALTALISPGYSPPEQYVTHSTQYHGPWTDIYALGATLYRCITGQMPMEALDRQLGEQLRLEPAERLGAGRYGRDLLAVVDRALALEPRQRFQSVAELRAALWAGNPPPPQESVETLLPEREAPADSGPVSAAVEPERLSQGLPHPDTPSPEASATGTGPGSGALPTPGRQPRKWVIAGILLLLTVAAAALVMERWQRPPGPAPAGEQDRVAAGTPAVETPRRRPQEAALQPLKTFRDRLADGSEGPEMVVIPAGEFWMGSPDYEAGRSGDEKRHRLRIERPFALGRHEVTVGEFRRFVEATGYRTEAEKGRGCYGRSGGTWRYDARYSWRTLDFEQGDDHPVVCVSGNDAAAYTGWLERQTGQPYRLPTEAEWEYAARAGTQTPYWWGERASHEYANYAGREGRDRWDYTAPVGSFPANPFGLADVLGNALEWTCSEYDADYGGAQTRCAGDSPAPRAQRGGSLDGGPRYVRTANRSKNPPHDRNDTVGFRLARELSP